MDYNKLKQLRDGEYFGNMLGLKHIVVREGYASTELKVKREFINLQNTIHGGILLTLADVTGGTAACSYGNIVATVDNSYHFLRAREDIRMLRAEAKVIRAGRRLIVTEVLVSDEAGTLLGQGIFTYMPLDMPIA